MVSKGYIRGLLHFYLQEDSPYYNGTKSASKPKDRSQNENHAYSNMGHLLGAVSVLVSGCSIQRDNANTSLSPVSRENVSFPISLPEEDAKVIFNERFFHRCISEGHSVDGMQCLAVHLSYENEFISNMIADSIVAGKKRIKIRSLG
jgi:hypothetical protein